MSNDNDQPTGLDPALALEAGNQVDYFQVAAGLERQLAAVEAERDRLAAEADQAKTTVYHLKTSLGLSNDRIAALTAELATTETDRDCYKAVLESAKFERVGELVARGIAFCKAVGIRAFERMKEMKAALETAETDRNHAIASIIAVSASLADAGFKGETVREQVASVVARVVKLEFNLLAELRAHGSTRVNLGITTAQLEEAEHHAKRYSIEYDRAKAAADEAKADNARLRQQIESLQSTINWVSIQCGNSDLAELRYIRQQLTATFISESIPACPYDKEYDATDGACPAWWRGQDYATSIFCQRVIEILEDKDDGAGANTEPWATVRKRLLELKSSHDHWREAAEAEIGITRRLTMLSDGIYDLSLSVADEFKDGNILDTFRRVIEERNALRQQVREIGEATRKQLAEKVEAYTEYVRASRRASDMKRAALEALATAKKIITETDLAACASPRLTPEMSAWLDGHHTAPIDEVAEAFIVRFSVTGMVAGELMKEWLAACRAKAEEGGE